MLERESILCFAPDPWDDIWRNRHQIMSLLAEQNQVLYVEPRPYLRSVVQGLVQRQLTCADLRLKPVRQVRPGLHVFSPPRYAPLSGRAPLRQITDMLRHRALRRAMGRLGMARPILWLFRPDMADVPGHYDEAFVIYHVVDEYTGYADVIDGQTQRVAERESALLARADLVLVTSEALLESKQGVNPHTYWVPNAVNYPPFAQAAHDRQPPRELRGIGRPRIGYVGAINDKLDTELLMAVAQALPEASLVLVGPERPASDAMRGGLEALHRQPNVCFVGQVAVERVPQLMAACDVGLLPYRRNAWTQHIHPLKMYEYLACGLPVVATDIPSVREVADLIDVVDDTAAFVMAVRHALLPQTAAIVQARQARAAENTWRQRVELISSLIDKVRRGG